MSISRKLGLCDDILKTMSAHLSGVSVLQLGQCTKPDEVALKMKNGRKAKRAVRHLLNQCKKGMSMIPFTGKMAGSGFPSC